MADPVVSRKQSNTAINTKNKPILKSSNFVDKFKGVSSSLVENLPLKVKATIANKVSDLASISKSIQENKEIEGRYFGSKLNNVTINSLKTKYKTDINNPLLYGELKSNITIDFTLRVVCKNQCGENKMRYLPNHITMTFNKNTPLLEGPYDNVPLIGAMKKFLSVKMTPMASAVSDSGVQIDKYIQEYGTKFGTSIATGMCRTAGSSVCK